LIVVVCVCTLLFVFNQGKSSLQGSVSVPSKPAGTSRTVSSLVTPPTRVQSSPPEDPTTPWIECISTAPRVYVYHNFLTPEECEEVIRVAGADVTRSLVVANKGGSTESEWRTSKGVFLTREYMTKSPLIRDIERKIAEWTQLPIENGEAFYLLRYDHGQQYKPHHDFFSTDESGKDFIGDSGNRFATVLTYLHSPDEGGETSFPQKNIKVPAKAGDSLLFYDLHPSNDPDDDSLHAGLPVVKGVKWAMTKWIREQKTWFWKDGADAATLQQWADEDKAYLAEKSKKGSKQIQNENLA